MADVDGYIGSEAVICIHVAGTDGCIGSREEIHMAGIDGYTGSGAEYVKHSDRKIEKQYNTLKVTDLDTRFSSRPGVWLSAAFHRGEAR